MALEGIILNSGSGGQKLATDTVGGFDFQIIKIGVGADDSTPTSVSDANPMPVDDAGGSLTVDNAGTFATQVDGAALTALQLIDDSIFADDAAFTLASSKVTMAGGIRDDSLSALTAVEGDAVPLRVDSTGALHVTGAGITQYTEDVATPNPILGNATLMERDDVLSTVTPAAGDWIGLRGSAEGALWVQDFNSDAILVDTTKIAGAVTGSEMQVDVVASLPAGTNAIGKLAANSGVDIGDVDVTSVIPGTGATNLGKALDSVVGATDTGVLVLAKHEENAAHIEGAEGDYVHFHVGELGALWVSPEQKNHLDEMDATAGWAVLGNDAANLATTTKHLTGTAALTFDKVNGAANTVIAGIAKTITTLDLGLINLHDIIQVGFYIPSLANVSYVFCRVGTDSTNYNEWRVPDTDLTAATFEIAGLSVGDANHSGITGNGWDPTAITYIAVGIAFDSETDTLAGIIFDQIGYFTNSHSVASLGAEISSSVNTANINLQKIGGSTTDKGSGNASNGSQRVVVATDDVNMAAIKTAVEIMDDWDETDRAAVNLISSQAGVAGGTGVDGATVLRVTLATDIPLPAGTNAIGKLAANSGVDIGDVDVLSLIPGTGATNLGKAIDTAAGATDTGIAALAIRDDSLTTLTPADGDYVPLRVSSTGALHVTGGGGGTEYTEDVATPNPIVGTATLIERDDALTAVTPVEGDWIGLRGTAEGALWVQDFNSDQIRTDNTTVAGAVSGSEMQVDVVAALPAGTNAIGKLSANSGVDIGDVDVTSLVPGTGATSLGKAEDAVHASDDTGVMGLAVRKATPADLSDTDGDYEPLQIDNGRLWVSATIDAALPAGTNAIGKLAANSGVDIGDVDIIGAVNATASGALAAENDAVTLASQGLGTVNWEIDTGTLVGTVVFEATLDDTNWFGVNIIRIDGGIVASTVSFADRGAFTSTGYSQVRLRVSSFSSGTSNARMEGSLFHGSVVRLGQALPGGSNAIGKLAANSGVDIGDVDVTSQPARAATTDNIGAKLSTDAIMDGTTALTPKYAVIAATASGDTAVVADVSGKKIRVLSLAVNAFGDTEVEFQDNGTTTTRSGNFDMGTSAGKAKGLVLAFSPVGHFETASGVGLDITLTQSVTVEGHLVYVEV